MKKISSILISLFLILNISVAEINIPQPTDNFFVNDFANVIEAEDEQVIFDIARELYESSGNSTQVVVVTIDSLDGNSIEEYANELFNTWGIGSKEKNDGVLVLLAVNDRRSRIEVGYGLEGLLPDGKTGTIQDDYMIPFYSENNFSEGIRSGTQAIIDVIKGDLVIEENVVDERIDTIFNISEVIYKFVFKLKDKIQGKR